MKTQQISLGTLGKKDCYSKIPSIWHSDSEGKYWCGQWYHRTPKQLKKECESILADLRKEHPEIFLGK